MGVFRLCRMIRGSYYFNPAGELQERAGKIIKALSPLAA